MHKFLNGFLLSVLTLPELGAGSEDPHLELASVFSDNMVLQREVPIPVFGTSNPGADVSVNLAGETLITHAGENGRWEVEFPTRSAGGPIKLVVRSDSAETTCRNVMIGDVWVCSGQSNMAWPVNTGVLRVANGAEEAAAADWPNIRFLSVAPKGEQDIQKEIDTLGWKVCDPESTSAFSGVGYFFGRDIHKHLGVPIGLINSSAGGTIVEAWTSQEGLEKVPEMEDLMRELAENSGVLRKIQEDFDQEFASWKAELEANDSGYVGSEPVWADPEFDVSDWQIMPLPNYWEEEGYPDFDGTLWFRKEIHIPEDWTGKDLLFRLASINDRIRIWFNGEEIVEWKSDSQAKTGFEIPGGIVRSGTNTMVCRIYDMGGNGGLFGDPVDMWIRPRPMEQEAALSLAGEWRCKPGFRMKEFPKLPRPPAIHPDNPNMPSRLYNAMIAPLVRTPIRGVIWYQGEGNSERSHQYQTLFPAMIRDWRNKWSQPDLPFLFVQLANFESSTRERNLGWAELREAQSMALSLPNTGMAVTIDIGEADDVHPKNKQDVGRRLALAARHIAYGEDLVYSGPRYEEHSIEGTAATIHFSHVGGGLKAEGDELTGFEIAGKNKEFHPAQAEIVGEVVRVWSEEISEPLAVRYAWDGNPDCNLYNEEGLPASPFRTDDWPGVTVGNVLALPTQAP